MERESLLLIIKELNKYLNRPIVTHSGVSPICEKDLMEEIKVVADKCIMPDDPLSDATKGLFSSLKCGPWVKREERDGDVRKYEPTLKNRTREMFRPPSENEWEKFSETLPENISKLVFKNGNYVTDRKDLEIEVRKIGPGHQRISIKEFVEFMAKFSEVGKYYTYNELSMAFTKNNRSKSDYVRRLSKRATYWGSFWHPGAIKPGKDGFTILRPIKLTTDKE